MTEEEFLKDQDKFRYIPPIRDMWQFIVPSGLIYLEKYTGIGCKVLAPVDCASEGEIFFVPKQYEREISGSFSTTINKLDANGNPIEIPKEDVEKTIKYMKEQDYAYIVRRYAEDQYIDKNQFKTLFYEEVTTIQNVSGQCVFSKPQAKVIFQEEYLVAGDKIIPKSQQSEEDSTKKEKDDIKWIAIGITGGAILLGIIILLFAMNKKKR